MAILTSQTGRTTRANNARLSARLQEASPCAPTMGNDPQEDHGDLLLLQPKTKTKRPPMFKVMMHNDDYTPMDFVVEILKSIFHLPHEDALSVMLQIHHQGCGLCGVFTRDVAETKIDSVIMRAREEGHPLHCTLERE